MAARGNATSFALPWQEVLAQLSAAEPDLQNAGEKSLVALPRTGSQLAEIVSSLSKTSGDDEYVGALSKSIHQATGAGPAFSSPETGWPSVHGAAHARDLRFHSREEPHGWTMLIVVSWVGDAGPDAVGCLCGMAPLMSRNSCRGNR